MDDSKIQLILEAGNVRPVFGGNNETKYYILGSCVFIAFIFILYEYGEATNFLRSTWLLFFIPILMFEISKRISAKIYFVKESDPEFLNQLTNLYSKNGYKVISKTSRHAHLETIKGGYLPKSILLVHEKGKLYGASWSTFGSMTSMTTYVFFYSGKNEIRKMKEYAH